MAPLPRIPGPLLLPREDDRFQRHQPSRDRDVRCRPSRGSAVGDQREKAIPGLRISPADFLPPDHDTNRFDRRGWQRREPV